MSKVDALNTEPEVISDFEKIKNFKVRTGLNEELKRIVSENSLNKAELGSNVCYIVNIDGIPSRVFDTYDGAKKFSLDFLMEECTEFDRHYYTNSNDSNFYSGGSTTRPALCGIFELTSIFKNFCTMYERTECKIEIFTVRR
jgi:hypothetical protein